MKYFLLSIFFIQNLAAQCLELPANDLVFEYQGFFKDRNCTERVNPLRPKNDKALRVLWWNVQYNGTGRRLDDQLGLNPLRENIKNLIRSDIDFIAFGEWKDNILTDEMQRLIQERYPYSRFVSYNSNKPKDGIFVLSKRPFESFEVNQLDWAPDEEYRQEWLESFDNAIGFERPFIQATVEHNDRSLTLTPVHLNNPWSRYIDREIPFEAIRTVPYIPISGGVDDFLERVTNTTDTALRIQMGGNSPLNYQLREMRKYRGKSDVIFGDFNIPKYLLPRVPTRLYREARGDLRDLALDQSPSYPTTGSQKGGRDVRIDQAFAREGLNTSQAYRSCLSGSDHYPIVFDIR